MGGIRTFIFFIPSSNIDNICMPSPYLGTGTYSSEEKEANFPQ